MKIHFLFWSRFFSILSKPVLSNKINKKSANQFLNSPKRPKRSNEGYYEEEESPNYERECVEEDCNHLEIREIITKDWPGRKELFRKMYGPTVNAGNIQATYRQHVAKTIWIPTPMAKTNINKPVFTLENNAEEFYKQASKDLNNIVNEPCKFYHPMQKDFYNNDYFTVDQDIGLCDEASTCTTVSEKTKNCQCKKSQGLHIRKGKFCEECHEDCYASGGSCQLNEENTADPEWSCQCPKLKTETTEGIIKVDEFKFFSEHTTFGFCSKPIDYCGNHMSNCDEETTKCQNTNDGYRCICKEEYVPDGDYNCRKPTEQNIGVTPMEQNSLKLVISAAVSTVVVALMISLGYLKRNLLFKNQCKPFEKVSPNE